MKKIYIIITIFLISTFSCIAQLNELTPTEFYGIKINGVTLRSIYDTNADLTKMRALFGSNLKYEYENDILITRQFWNDALTVNFESDIGNDYYISFINLNNSSANVTVKGVTVNIGDDKSVFGKSVVLNTNKGDNSIVFIDQLTGTAALAFKIDKKSNKIIAIKFNTY